MTALYQPVAADFTEVIPPKLIPMARWLLWRAETATHSPKPRKVPYYASGKRRCGKLGTQTDLQQLVTLPVALAEYDSNPRHWAGVGFALVDGDGVGAVDIDGCFDGDQLVRDNGAIDRILRAVFTSGCYVERSPSRNGVRVVGETSGFQTLSSPVEAYCRRRYVTFTGDVIRNSSAWASVDPVIDVIRTEHSQAPKIKAQSRRFDLAEAITGGLRAADEGPHMIERVRSALAVLDPDLQYPEWIKVIFAMRSTNWSCAEEIARTWSAGGNVNNPTSQKYDAVGFDRAWLSSTADGGITLGTLFDMAKKVGWKRPSQNDHSAAQGERDIRNGRLFAAGNRGKLLKIVETEQLLEHTEAGWRTAKYGEGVAKQAAITVIEALTTAGQEKLAAGEADAATKLFKHVSYSSTAARLDAMANIGWSEPGMSVSGADLDAAPHLLGTQNGTLDLLSRSLLASNPSVLVTKRIRVVFDPEADCPTYKRFMKDVQPDPDMRRFLRRVAGTFLWGEPCEQKLYFLYGLGANGKSTFIEILAWLLGDYATRIQTESLMRHDRNPQGHSADLAVLKGVRLAFCNEVPEGRRLDEARVKELTGGDTISARLPYGREPMIFSPSHTLVMIGNHQPEIHDMSHGMWRRLALALFGQTIPTAQQDGELLSKLKLEGSGILNWMLCGLADYRTNGLALPQSVATATDAYRDDQDILGQWLNETCTIGKGYRADKQTVYLSYKAWAEGRGHRSMSATKFTRRLKERNYPLDAGRHNYEGFNLIGAQARSSPTKV